MNEDLELLRRFADRAGEVAFAELVRRHVSLVYFAALRRVDGRTQLAEEVTQSVFARLAVEARRMLARKTVLAGWLYVAAKHTAANALRAEKRRETREQEAMVMQDLLDTRQEEAAWAAIRPEIDSALDALSERDRDAVLLRFFEGRAFGEIGEELRVSEDAARVRVNRALEKLRGLLAKRGVTSTAAALGGLLTGNAAVAAPVGLAASVTGAVLAGGGVVGFASAGVGGMASALSASAGGAAGAGVLTFMSTTKLIMTVACVVAAVAVGTAVWQNRMMGKVRMEAVLLRQENERLAAAIVLRDTTKQNSERAQGLPVSGTNGLADQRKPGEEKIAEAKSPDPKEAADPVKAVAERLAPILLDPAYQELSVQVHRTALPMTYGAFYRTLNLTADQINQLERLLTERKQNQIDLLVASQTQGMSIDDPSLSRLKNIGTEAALHALLGENGYRAFERYEKTLPAREEVERVASGVYYTESPLSLAQGEALAEIIVANTKAGPTRGVVELPGQVSWEAVYADAAKVLSPTQLHAMKIQKEKADMDQQFLSLRMKLLRKQTARSREP